MSDKKLDLILSELHSLREESNKRFDRNEEMISTLIQMVGATNAELKDVKQELGNKIDKLAEGQERQDRILESLGIRSLEQESYIRDLKRQF